MRPELSQLNKKQFKDEMKRRDEEMKSSGKENSIGLKRFGSAFFKKQVAHFIYAVFRAFLLIGLSYIVLYPVFKMLSNAFSEDYVKSATSIWIPNNVGMNNFGYAVTLLKYWESFWASVKVALGSSILQVISAALAGYGFARFKFKGRGALFALVILTMIVPPQTYLISMFMTYRKFDLFGILDIVGLIAGKDMTWNLIGTPWTMWIPAFLGVGLRGGLFIYIFRQFFRGMSKELEEAAYIDGCGPFMTFLRIMVPNALSSGLVVFLFSLVWHWNDYFTVSMMYTAPNKPRPLTLTLMSEYKTLGVTLFGEGDVNSTYILNAACALIILPLLLVFAVAQRFFIESMDKVGIKG